jgi:hypothetical protein
MNPSHRTLCFRHRFLAARALLISVGFLTWVHAQEPAARSAQEWLGSVVGKVMGMIEPGARDLPQTLSATVRVLETEGLGNGLAGQTMDVAFQAPDRLQVSARVQGRELRAGRFGQELWSTGSQDTHAGPGHRRKTGARRRRRWTARGS